MKWTKTDLRRVQSQIDGFVLYHEPRVPSAAIRKAIEDDRLRIVLLGLRGHVGLLEDRANQNERTAAHFRDTPAIYGASTPEMVARFERLAAEVRREIAVWRRLIRRVEASGLPPEMEAYLPARLGS